MSQEAICDHCKTATIVKETSRNNMVNCDHCGEQFLFTREKLILRSEVFSKKNSITTQEAQFKFPISFLRHGQDSYQKGTLYKITTKLVKFTSKTKLWPTTKITFIIFDKKFIVSIKDCKTKKITDEHGYIETVFDIAATFVTISQGTRRKLVKTNPHYLTK
ncbi:MAG: hypothetical protein COA79_25215 [Planctomycetota bacterium]|nr:MAG: hypothetical protein COA79_25215 [Planctomycetota bacterium]